MSTQEDAMKVEAARTEVIRSNQTVEEEEAEAEEEPTSIAEIPQAVPLYVSNDAINAEKEKKRKIQSSAEPSTLIRLCLKKQSDKFILVIGAKGSGKGTIIYAITGDENIRSEAGLGDITDEVTIVAGTFELDGITYALKIVDTVGYGGDHRSDEYNLSETFERCAQEITKVHKIIVVVSASRYSSINVSVAEMLKTNLSDHAKSLVHFVITRCAPYDEARLKAELMQRVTQFGDLTNRITCVDLIDRRRFQDDEHCTHRLEREWYSAGGGLRRIIADANNPVQIVDAFIRVSLEKILKKNWQIIVIALLSFIVVILLIQSYTYGKSEGKLAEEEVRRILRAQIEAELGINKTNIFGQISSFFGGIFGNQANATIGKPDHSKYH
jgi:GTPase SAR1 family protein